MSASDLVQIFGSALPWIATLSLLLLALLVTLAFWQGRDISLWPPRIGPRTGPWIGPRTSVVGHEAIEQPARPSNGVVVDREYSVGAARDFYQMISTHYDLRNSGNLTSTHLATVAELQSIRSRHDSLRVLDLGGGTGKLIAVHFFNDADIAWTYVDYCPAMAEEFRRNLSGTTLSKHARIVLDDLMVATRRFAPQSFDVVVLSLVLSSMPALPDFAPIARVLAPGGELIVTDISPGYTHENPLYKVAMEGSVVALRTSPVDPYEVVRRAAAAGLEATRHTPIGEGNTYYSFLTVFTPTPVRPDEELTDDGGLILS
jgi:ubiquinone/menaquinone biosynthesis C-methylase UbiE